MGSDDEGTKTVDKEEEEVRGLPPKRDSEVENERQEMRDLGEKDVEVGNWRLVH